MWEMKNIVPILLLIFLNSCTGQNKNTAEKESTIIRTDTIILNKLNEINDGIVYFSKDNGRTWENKSRGLPEKIKIGLGGIAASATLLGLATKEQGIYIFDFKDSIWVHIPTDEQIIKNNIGALVFYKNEIYIGTQFGGVFFSNNQGKTWVSKNSGLGNLTIRRFAEIDNRLFVGTNGGLYSFDEPLNKWELEFGQNALQVNGITEFEGNIYIATNQGVFKTEKEFKNWKQVLFDSSVHNISSDSKTIYAMTYNELLSSTDKGVSWQNIQNGLPKELYTFNVIENENVVFAGQWDGVYRKDGSSGEWKLSSNGLPNKFAITNIKAFNGLLVSAGSERKLKTGMTTEK